MELGDNIQGVTFKVMEDLDEKEGKQKSKTELILLYEKD